MNLDICGRRFAEPFDIDRVELRLHAEEEPART